MPKLKTNRSAAKRFRRTKNGKFKRNKSGARHIMTKKSPKRKRNLRKAGLLSDQDQKIVAKMLPYS